MADRPKKFIKGHNVLKSKGSSKQISKVKELERKKAEEAETAAVLNEYIADFQTGAAGGKTFVRAGIINPNKSEEGEPQVKTEENEPKFYKPKSKMQELAEEFKKSKAVSEDYKSSKENITKKKNTEKKKSNLELFKEELEQSQLEREIRRKIKKGDLSGVSEETLKSLPSTFFNAKPSEDEFNFQYAMGSRDTGDPATTNLFVSNLNPKMNEEQLCRVFGKYGPLASVKIMWPRTEEEKSRNRNCGFVAFMNRKDGEKALDDIEGKDVMDFEMKIGWGKAVPIPPVPIYIHPSQSRAIRPPKQSGLPFNCQLPYKMRKAGTLFDGNLEITVVKVVIPTERTILSLINRVVEFVVREGPMFEAMIMNREIANPMFRFLFDNKSNEHIYYRWRVFSLLQGDTTSKWQTQCFRMFKGGSLWQPPAMNPFGQQTFAAASSATHSAILASASNSNVHNPPANDLTMKKNLLLEQLLKDSNREEKEEKEKKALSDRQRDKLEDMLRTLTTDRTKIGELMRWAIDHAEYAEEIVECICESLSIDETPLPTKIARLYVVNDILHNSGVKVTKASTFRKYFQNNLLETMENLQRALATCSTKAQQEKFRKQVLSCLAAWQDWSLYPPMFLINLQNVFVGISTSKNIKEEEEAANQENLKAKVESEIDGLPLVDEDEEDLDGAPMDVDGIPIEEDLDGIPLSKDEDVVESRWTKQDSENSGWQNDENDPLKESRWQKDETKQLNNGLDQTKFKPGKWEKVEGVKEAKSTVKEEEEEDIDGEPYESPSEIEKKKSKSKSPQPEESDDRRRFLRDVEVKVMRFVDKLEQKGASKSGLNIQKEAAKFRQQLIDEYDKSRDNKDRRRKKNESRKRDRSRSPSSGESKRKRSSRRRSRSRTFSDSDSGSVKHQRSGRRNNDSPPNYSPRRSFSRSPQSRFSSSPGRSPRRSPIFRNRSRSPYSGRQSPVRRSRSFSFSPRRSISPRRKRSISPRSPQYSRYKRSPSPLSYSPRRSSSSATKSSKKKKSKKSKK